MTVEKPKSKQLLRPITTGANSAMNQLAMAITCNSLEAREKSRVHGAVCFGFAFHWLKNWRESFKPITRSSNRNRVIYYFRQSIGNCSNYVHSSLCLFSKLVVITTVNYREWV